jgi:hypothetical protein
MKRELTGDANDLARKKVMASREYQRRPALLFCCKRQERSWGSMVFASSNEDQWKKNSSYLQSNTVGAHPLWCICHQNISKVPNPKNEETSTWRTEYRRNLLIKMQLERVWRRNPELLLTM